MKGFQVEGELDWEDEAVVAGEEDDEEVPPLDIDVFQFHYTFLKETHLFFLVVQLLLLLLFMLKVPDLKIFKRLMHIPF